MIVDCHTQVWDSSTWLGDATLADGDQATSADTARHLEAVAPVDIALVLGFKSRHLGAEIPNDFVANYTRRAPERLVGFAGIDPTEESCFDDLKHAIDELQLRGVSISPTMQNFHPSATPAMAFYEACCEREIPAVIELSHQSLAANMEFGRPMLIDEVAREFPELRIVITNLGYPWIEEAVVVLGKHKHVYAEISGILHRPWLAYRSLLAAFEHGVMEKLLFGSGFPSRTPASCIEALYTVNHVSHGTNLITIPREHLRGIVERDALKLLGVEQSSNSRRPEKQAILADDE